MQFGFGKKKNKKHKKKGKAKPAGDDDVMQDAADAAPMQTAAEMEDAEHDDGMSAKEKQRRRMELKKALRVKVNQLKSTRSRLVKSKAPVSKESKLNMKAEVKELLQEQLNIGKPSSS